MTRKSDATADPADAPLKGEPDDTDTSPLGPNDDNPLDMDATPLDPDDDDPVDWAPQVSFVAGGAVTSLRPGRPPRCACCAASS